MKRLTSIPPCVIDQIKTEHERAMDALFRDTHRTYRLPSHIVAMKIQQSQGKDKIESVIIPAIVIHLTGNAFYTKNTLNRDCIKYTLQSTRKPFPFGHIYQDSGHVCLGNIFVPSAVSCHSPQQPLETLFLYNDRNVSHGRSTIELSEKQISQIMTYLLSVDIALPDDIRDRLMFDYNLVRNDALWALSSYVLRTSPNTAFTIMQYIFDIVFPPDEIPQ